MGESFADDGLSFRFVSLQVIIAEKALRVNFVNIFRVGVPGCEPKLTGRKVRAVGSVTGSDRLSVENSDESRHEYLRELPEVPRAPLPRTDWSGK